MNDETNLDKEQELARYMEALGIREQDIEESFVRSGGHGGQNVNKTSTCVMLMHRPSGVRVKCQTTRHQGMNRFLGRWLLFEKIQALRKKEADSQKAEAERVRRQNRPRNRKAKSRILADKSHQAAKKAQRRRGAWDE